MISVDRVLEHYLDDVECLRLVAHTAKSRTGITSKRFANLTPLLLNDRLERLRRELDRAFVLTMIASGEGRIRTDFAARVSNAATATGLCWKRIAFVLHLPRVPGSNLVSLEDRLVDLRVRYGSKVPLEEILASWKQSGADTNLIGQFKQLINHRHWLAHGRYFQDRSGISPDPRSAHAVITTVFAEFTALRADFPI